MEKVESKVIFSILLPLGEPRITLLHEALGRLSLGGKGSQSPLPISQSLGAQPGPWSRPR